MYELTGYALFSLLLLGAGLGMLFLTCCYVAGHLIGIKRARKKLQLNAKQGVS